MISYLRKEEIGISLSMACKLFGLSRDAWYKAEKRKSLQLAMEQLILHQIREIRLELPGIGGRKLHYELQDFLNEHGIKYGRNKVFDLLRRHDLLIKRRKRRKITTNSNHPFRKYKNLVKDLKLTRSNQLWVSDITYIRIGSGFLYLSLITDAYSRKIIGWSLEKDLRASGPVRALKQAIKQRPKSDRINEVELYHHSDRGLQYCSHEHTGLLKRNNIKISMTQNGDPGENALAERMNGTIKEEFLRYWFHGNEEAAFKSIEKAIKNYNEKRPHENLNYMTPNQIHDLETIS